MNTDKLISVRDNAEIKRLAIDRLLGEKAEIEQAVADLKYLQRHAGEMIFTGNSGKIGERDVMLKTIKINTIAGCVAVPELLIDLAEKKLAELEKQADSLLA